MTTPLETTLQALREFVEQQGWTIAHEKDVPSGRQVSIRDGLLRAPVTCYTNGNVLVQGDKSSLQDALQQWALAWRQYRGKIKPSQYTNENLWSSSDNP